MRFTILITVLTATALTTSAATQQPPADPVRTGITVMRAINTAANAAKHESGKFPSLADLVNHAAMSRVRADIIVNGDALTHLGRPLRMTISPDGMHYQAMVVPTETCGTAVFSTEVGLIYTGKVLDCK